MFLADSAHPRAAGQLRTLILLPESSISNPASRTRCYALVNKLSGRRQVALVQNKEHPDRVIRFLLNLINTLTLYPMAKRAQNHVTLFVQRGTKSRMRVELLLVWRQVTESRLVFDFDDAIFLHSPGGTRQVCRAADAIFAANEYLADYARQFSDRVSVVPTSIDLGVYQRQTNAAAAKDVPVIGWIGTSWNLEYLRLLVKPLQRLKASHDFLLTLITDPSGVSRLHLPSSIPLQIIPWRLGDFVRNLATFDVGVCPLPDDAFTRGKSGYKVLEYMALGIPPVASPVGGIVSTVDHGVDGLLAASGDEWYRCLRDLLDDPARRDAMGRAGRRKVETRFSLDRVVQDIEKILDAVEQA